MTCQLLQLCVIATFLLASIVTSYEIYYLDCNDAFDPLCFRQSIILNATQSTVYCRGYSSCREASELIVYGGDALENTFNKQYIYCHGGRSCYNVTSVMATNINSNDIRGQIMCYGDESCAFSYLQCQDYIYCYGQRSCINSNISVTEHDITTSYLTLECGGELSCANTTIYNVNKISGDGRFSLYNGKIYGKDGLALDNSNDDTSTSTTDDGYDDIDNILEITLTGNYAGYNSSIYCNNVTDCILNCYGNGCYNTRFYCNSSISNCAVKCGMDSTSDDRVSFSNCPLNCSFDSNGINSICDEYNINSKVELDLDGYFLTQMSGINTENSCTTSDDSDNKDIYNYNNTSGGVLEFASVLCDDFMECFDDNNISLIIDSNNYGNICCRGSNACGISNKFQFLSDIREDAYDKDMNIAFCEGYSSCAGSNIVINSDIESIFYCSASYGCVMSNITDKSSSIQSTVYCVGHYACQLSTMRWIKTIICSGKNSCLNTVFSGIQDIKVYGFYGLMFATVYTDGFDLNISLNAHYSGYKAKIYCNQDDKCIIECLTGTACKDMQIYCIANCDLNVTCDELNGIVCPYITYVSTTTSVPWPTLTSMQTSLPVILTTGDISEDSDSGESSEGSEGNTSSDNGLWFIVGGAVALLILVVIAVLYVKRSQTNKNGQFRNVNVRQEMIPSNED